MKKFFPGYYPLEGESANELWDNGVIMLDSSFLLGLFCLKQDVASSILSILEKENIKNKLWIAYDAAWHYHYFVNDVVLRQIESIEKMKYLLNQALSLANSEKSYPYFSSEFTKQLDSVVSSLVKECDSQKNNEKDMLYGHDLKNRIDSLFCDRVGEPYEIAQMEELYKQGESRYIKQLPPGYSTSSYEDKRLRYHDFIVWQQLIRHAKNAHKNIIMCTARLNNDWFYMIDGDSVISNSQIVNEFQEEAHQSFRCYNLKVFLDECLEHKLIAAEERSTIPEKIDFRFDVTSNDSMMTTQNNSQS